MIYEYILYCIYYTFRLFTISRVKQSVSQGDSKTSTVAEEESGFSTKQVLGYLWTPSLLKKHGKPAPAAKKMTTIQHQGKPVKGVILEEWVVGALSC